jgi:uncharacterized protein (TIGR03437 family)
MVGFYVRRMQAAVVAAAAMFCVAASDQLVAANPAVAPNVTYTAAGMFATTPINGNDLFKLAGQTFSISVVVNAATVPTAHGAHWASYTKQKMTGTVTSGLEPTPLSISSGLTSIELGTGNPSYDVFELFAPVNVIGIQINVLADIHMPTGTITSALVHPFASTPLAPPDQMSYTDPATGASTTLAIASGTVVATIPGGSTVTETPASVQLHAGNASVITAHADGIKSVRSLGTAAVDLGAASDKVVLQFFASGVRDGSEVRVQIAGRDVPILYAGPAEHFAGLDQVNVTVPRSLAGSGDVDVVLSVDGRTASPLHLQIQ